MATIDEEATRLAEKHYQVEIGLRDVIRLERSSDCGGNGHFVEKIGLLEVNENTVPSGVMPIEFAPVPSSGIHYPTVIVEVTPDEYALIRADQLALPEGWVLGKSIPRPNGAST